MKTIDFFCFIFSTNFILIFNKKEHFSFAFDQKIKLQLLDQFHLDLERFMVPIFRSIKILHNIKNNIKHHPIYKLKLTTSVKHHLHFYTFSLYLLNSIVLFSNNIHNHTLFLNNFSLILTLSKINNQIFSLNSTQHYTKNSP